MGWHQSTSQNAVDPSVNRVTFKQKYRHLRDRVHPPPEIKMTLIQRYVQSQEACKGEERVVAFNAGSTPASLRTPATPNLAATSLSPVVPSPLNLDNTVDREGDVDYDSEEMDLEDLDVGDDSDTVVSSESPLYFVLDDIEDEDIMGIDVVT
ncbi:hypothetical protein ABKN59_010278 [Abortiporus biennis]